MVPIEVAATDPIYILHAMPHPKAGIDIAALARGGSLAPATHSAVLSKPSLATIRENCRLVRTNARVHGFDVSFCKLLRREALLPWLERTRSKAMML